jgi:hypothetical protein
MLYRWITREAQPMANGRAPIGKAMPWLVVVAVLLVVPGVILSFVLPAIGGLMLAVLALDYTLAPGDEIRPKLHPLTQVVIAALLAAVIGGVIALGAWFDK